MQTILLSDEDVRRYARDFVSRLHALGDRCPKLWLALGRSGDHMVRIIRDEALKQYPAILDGLQVANIGCDRVKGRVFDRGTNGEIKLDGDPGRLLLVDSAVHSGRSMSMILDNLREQGAHDVGSYTLTLKRSSEFVPNYFGMIVGEHDRTYFLLDSLPNNRLNDDASSAVAGTTFSYFRAIRESDAFSSKQTLPCEVPSISAVTLGDLWYDVRAHGQKVYLLEMAGQTVGFVSFAIQGGSKLFLDIVARDQNYKQFNVGGQLLRWMETYARSSNCYAIEFWAFEDAIQRYIELGYNLVPSEPLLKTSATETYYKMQKRILYNIKPEGFYTVDAGAQWD